MGSFYLIEHPDKGAVKFCLGNLLKKPVHTEVYGSIAKGTGLSSQCTGKIALATPGRTGNKYVLSPPYKAAVGQADQLIACQISGGIACKTESSWMC
jgi:hypothetical protein